MPRAILAAIPVATSLIAILTAQSCAHREAAGDPAPNHGYQAIGAPRSAGPIRAVRDAAPGYGYGTGAPLQGETIDVRRSARGAEAAGAPADTICPSARARRGSEITEVTRAAPPGAQAAYAHVEGASLEARGPAGEAAVADHAPSGAHFSSVEPEDAGLKARGPVGDAAAADRAPSGALFSSAGPEDAGLKARGPVGDAAAADRAPSGALFSSTEPEDAGLKARGPMGSLQEGLATARGVEFTGRATPTGEWFDPEAPMAAHPNMPLPSLAEIVNLENGRRMVVRVNDRQPGGGEDVEVSRRVADELRFSVSPAHVSLRYLGPAPVAAGLLPDAGSPALPGAAPAAPYRAPPRLRAGYVVQVGSFGDPANAERLRSTLESAASVEVKPTQAGSAPLYRVRLGPWPDRAEAEAMRQQLVLRGFLDAIVAAR